MDQFSLNGKTAVVTGAARGLGLKFADVLAEAGANVAVLDIGDPGESLREIAKKYGVRTEHYRIDVTRRDQITEVIERIEQAFGSVDINVNAAGVCTDEPFLTTSDKNLDSTFAVNFVGSFLVAQACANAMVRKWERFGKPAPSDTPPIGSIVFVASVVTHIPSVAQNISCYIASKAAVRGLVKPMAMELGRYGIRVNSLSPGPMRTEMMNQAEIANPNLVKQFNKEGVFGRVGNPDELKPAVLYLCSSSWTTGQDLLVDGGISSWKHPAAI